MDSTQEEKKRPQIPEEFIQKEQEAEDSITSIDINHALEIFKNLTTRYPDIDRGWFGLARSYYLLGNYVECAKAYKKCLSVSPLFGLFHKFSSMGMGQPGKMLDMAEALANQDMNAEALKFADKLVEMELDDTIRGKVSYLREHLKSQMAKAQKTAGEGEYTKESKSFGSVMKLVVTIVVGLLLIGAGYLIYNTYMGSDITSGIEKYGRGMDLYSSFQTSEKPEELNMAIRNFKSSEDHLNKVLKRNPDDAQALFYLASIYMKKAEIKGAQNKSSGSSSNPQEVIEDQDYISMAETHLTRVIQVSPDYADAYLLLARVRLNQKKYDEAKELLSESITLAPTRYKSSSDADKKKVNDITTNAKALLKSIELRKSRKGDAQPNTETTSHKPDTETTPAKPNKETPDKTDTETTSHKPDTETTPAKPNKETPDKTDTETTSHKPDTETTPAKPNKETPDKTDTETTTP